MTIKSRMLVKGNVQAVGFRALIKQIARNMCIKGSVKNLDNGTVEIYSECEEAVYEEFKRKINISARDAEDNLQINVTNIEERSEDWDGFDGSRIMYPFDVVYDGLEIRPFERELLERSEMAVLAMTSMNRDINRRFDTLAERYDTFGNSMIKLEKDIHEMKDAFIKLADHFLTEGK
jgi:acylphosphatase